MDILKHIVLIFSINMLAIISNASEKDLLSLFPTNIVERNQNIDIDHVISAKMITFAALAEPADITYAYESYLADIKVSENQQGVKRYEGRRYFTTQVFGSPPEKTPEMASKRLEYLSIWVATVTPEEIYEGKEQELPIVIIGQETPAFAWVELPPNLFRSLLKSSKSAVFGLNKVPADKVKKAFSNLVVWRKDGDVFYQEAMHKKEGEAPKLWEDIKTLNLPEDGPFYVIVDVGIGKKGKKKILDRFKNEREFQQRTKELESGTNTYLSELHESLAFKKEQETIVAFDKRTSEVEELWKAGKTNEYYLEVNDIVEDIDLESNRGNLTKVVAKLLNSLLSKEIGVGEGDLLAMFKLSGYLVSNNKVSIEERKINVQLLCRYLGKIRKEIVPDFKAERVLPQMPASPSIPSGSISPETITNPAASAQNKISSREMQENTRMNLRQRNLKATDAVKSESIIDYIIGTFDASDIFSDLFNECIKSADLTDKEKEEVLKKVGVKQPKQGKISGAAVQGQQNIK